LEAGAPEPALQKKETLVRAPLQLVRFSELASASQVKV